MSADGSKAPSRRDRNAELSKLVGLLTRLGPNLNEIAKQIGVYKETARYRYRHLLLDRGFSLKVVPNYKKLGLDRLILIAAFPPNFRPHAKTIFAFLHEHCYVKEVEQTAVEGWFIIQVAVPTELVDPCADLFKQLEQLGVFSHLEIYRFESVRTPPMMGDHYDFGTGLWTYAWPPKQKVPLVPATDSQRESYDKVDLLILRELQVDPNKSLWKISERLGMGYRKLVWHLGNHVRGNGLIDGYAISWMATKFDNEDGRTRRYLPIIVFLTGATEGTRISLMALIQRLPFLWFEASGSDYFASLYLPPQTVNEFLSQLRDLNIDAQKLRYFITNQESAEEYGVSYHLFDGPSRKWQLNKPDVMKKFENLLLEVRSS